MFIAAAKQPTPTPQIRMLEKNALAPEPGLKMSRKFIAFMETTRHIDVDQQKLDAFSIPMETIGSAVSSNNVNLSSGVVKMSKEQYNLEVRSEYIESREIEDIVVTTTPAGQKVFVKDVATVRDSIKDLSLDEKTNGRDGVRMRITKQSGANTVKICKNVRKEMEHIKHNLPDDIEITVLFLMVFWLNLDR